MYPWRNTASVVGAITDSITHIGYESNSGVKKKEGSNKKG